MRENENPIGGIIFAFMFVILMIYVSYLCEIDESEKIQACLNSKRTYQKINENQYGCK